MSYNTSTMPRVKAIFHTYNLKGTEHDVQPLPWKYIAFDRTNFRVRVSWKEYHIGTASERKLYREDTHRRLKESWFDVDDFIPCHGIPDNDDEYDTDIYNDYIKTSRAIGRYKLPVDDLSHVSLTVYFWQHYTKKDKLFWDKFIVPHEFCDDEEYIEDESPFSDRVEDVLDTITRSDYFDIWDLEHVV